MGRRASRLRLSSLYRQCRSAAAEARDRSAAENRARGLRGRRHYRYNSHLSDIGPVATNRADVRSDASANGILGIYWQPSDVLRAIGAWLDSQDAEIAHGRRVPEFLADVFPSRSGRGTRPRTRVRVASRYLTAPETRPRTWLPLRLDRGREASAVAASQLLTERAF